MDLNSITDSDGSNIGHVDLAAQPPERERERKSESMTDSNSIC